MALCVREYIILARCRMSEHEDIISAWEKLLKGDEVQVRPMYRSPSVPSIIYIIYALSYRIFN